MQEYSMKIIAHIHNGFDEKFGIPRQSGLSEAESVIVFEPEYRNEQALRGLEEYGFLWLIWVFSQFVRSEWSPTVRPPRLGGNKRMGVFATRSPNRPNPIGLSSVEIVKIVPASDQGPLIYVKGADLLDGTPILDIKPYLVYADSHPDARGGFAEIKKEYRLDVRFSPEASNVLDDKTKKVVSELLAQDPRPAYQNDSNRIYTMSYDGWSIRFSVADSVLTVKEIFR